jgi:hypothetical protein
LRTPREFDKVAGRGIVVNEERDSKGYRVRLRVVEEYELALLAESSQSRPDSPNGSLTARSRDHQATVRNCENEPDRLPRNNRSSI